MSVMATLRSDTRLQSSLDDLVRLLERHRVLDALAQHEGPRRDVLESLQHRQNLAELNRRLRAMHVADIAYALEALPPPDRQTIWTQVGTERAGEVLVELSPAVRTSIVEDTPREVLHEMLRRLDPDDLHYVSPSLPRDLLDQVTDALQSVERSAFEQAVRYRPGSVGHHMSRELTDAPDTGTVGDVLSACRRRGELPPQTDHVFVVDGRRVLRGAVPLPTLLIHEPATPLAGVLRDDIVCFGPQDDVREAVTAFERYDLVSAPVLDERGRLIGRLTVDAAMDVLREESNLQALRTAGLRGDEDLFAAPWDSARNRWPWLGVNLVTAFLASRVIGQFEATIQQMASLAALMPIVASIGGNTGNQTMALMIRALAVDQLQPAGAVRLLKKELLIGLLNGSVWGLLIGAFAILMYAEIGLGVVMSAAVVMNLVVAAVAGVVIPVALQSAGRDPAHGASVLLTFITDAMGFFLFLLLASVFLFR
jgi:magnesium transporter